MIKLSSPEVFINHSLIAKIKDSLEEIKWWIVISEARYSLATLFHNIRETVWLQMFKNQIHILAKFIQIIIT